jgi:hypothetical protein
MDKTKMNLKSSTIPGVVAPWREGKDYAIRGVDVDGWVKAQTKVSNNRASGNSIKGDCLQKIIFSTARDGIHQMVIQTLSGFRYLCQQLAYLVLSRIFPIASQIDESLESYQDYSAKSVGKQGGEFLIAALVKS